MSIPNEFDTVLNNAITDIKLGKTHIHYYDILSNLLKQGLHGNLYNLIYEYHPYTRERHDYVNHLEDLLYFLLSEGIRPDIQSIHLCCIKRDYRLVEDLLKYHEGPLVIEMDNTTDISILLIINEIVYGFNMKLMICMSNQTLSLLEYALFSYVLNCPMYCDRPKDEYHYEWLIKNAYKRCPLPNMDRLYDLAEEMDLNPQLFQRPYEFYQELSDIV